MKGDIEFQVKNLNYKATEDDFEDFLKKEKIEFVTFEFEYLDDGRPRGVAYITLTKPNAEKLIDLDNKVFLKGNFSLNIFISHLKEERLLSVSGMINPKEVNLMLKVMKMKLLLNKIIRSIWMHMEQKMKLKSSWQIWMKRQQWKIFASF